MVGKFKSLAAQLEYEHIQELKNNKEKTFEVLNDNIISHMLILNRGEQLFYQEGDKAFICEISVKYDIVISDSIKKWDNGEKITSQEKEQIKRNIAKFFLDNYKTNMSFN